MALPLLVLAAVASNTSGPSFTVAGWQAAIIIAAAVCAGLVTLWKFVWPALNKFVNAVNSWPGIQENAKHATDLAEVAKLAPLVEKIAGQFDNNGGGTMRDVIDENTRLTKQAVASSAEAVKLAHEAASTAKVAADAAATLAVRVGVLEGAPSSQP